MADPLSFSASLIAVIGAARQANQWIGQIREKSDAKMALLNEVTDFMLQLHVVERCGSAPEGLEQQMKELLDKTRNMLVSMENSLKDHPKGVFRSQVRLTNVYREMYRRTEDIEKNAGRIALELQEVHVECQEIRTELTELHATNKQFNRIDSQQKRQAFIPNEEVFKTQPYQDTAPSRKWSPQHPSTRIVQTVAQATQRQPTSHQTVRIETLYRESETCVRNCNCVCHRRGEFRSSGILERLCGSIFVGYVGLPYMSSCNEWKCRRRSGPGIRITYYFPWWLCIKLGWLATLNMDLPSPECRLRMIRTVSKDAELFHLAGSGDITSIVEIFRQRKASPLDVSADDGRSALHTAVNMGRFATCEVLLKEGADPHLPDMHGISPVIMAWEKYLYLPETSPLRTKIEQVFLDRSHIEDFNFTTLHEIVIGLRKGDIVGELNRSPTSINQPDLLGNSPLLWAIKRSDLRNAHRLLDQQADPNIGDIFKRSPLHYAVRCGDSGLIRKLIGHNANVRQRTYWGSTPLHFAVVQGGDNTEFLTPLFDSGLDMEDTTEDGRTALSEAAKYDRRNVTEFLINKGANIEHVSKHKETPLMEAVVHKSYHCLQLLLKEGANYLGTNSRGNTVLHLAALNANIETLQVLTNHTLKGVDEYARNADGLIAIEIAQERERKSSDESQIFLRAFMALIKSVRDNIDLDSDGSRSDNDFDATSSDLFSDALEFQ
ncbi:ankyrin [Glonium stellatum]|uniref:Ankyrin n=1 Tax=Glonium stellatum TaxID=574774 RepID=A0A8E2EQE4_9PEZI|nr:ankyrin [Glonium stellatum]